jgi:hypothetical protein
MIREDTTVITVRKYICVLGLCAAATFGLGFCEIASGQSAPAAKQSEKAAAGAGAGQQGAPKPLQKPIAKAGAAAGAGAEIRKVQIG